VITLRTWILAAAAAVVLATALGSLAAAQSGTTPPTTTAPGGEAVDPRILDGTAQRHLDAARKRWKAFGAKSYTYSVTCTPCMGDATEKIRVVGGKAKSPKSDYRTVERLFSLVQGHIKDKVFGLQVSYGPKTGVPSRISVDATELGVDDNTGVFVEHFRRITR
jgi:hypothetical protein